MRDRSAPLRIVIVDALGGGPPLLRRGRSYHDRGTMATIGYRRAVAEFGARKLSGSIAWLLWSVVHVFLLIGFRSCVMVMGQWASRKTREHA